jgi:hypothetical protein
MIDNNLLVQMLIGALLGVSVYLPLAAGQLSLATPAFYAVGGTLAALLSTTWPALGAGADGSLPLASFLLELLLGGLLAGALALLVGRPVLRLQGIYLAIATIALVEIVRVAILNLPFTGGAIGIFGIPQPFPTAAGYLLPALGLLALAGWVCQRLEVIQTNPQVISLRFLRTQDDLLSPRRLQLIGRINGGEGLDCDANGCTLTPQLHLEVTAIATMQFDSRGLAKVMPIGNVARGQCQWQQRQLRCRFQVGKGPDWSIQASL